MSESNGWFERARYGLFIHYSLFSLLGRGEWVMNREQIPVIEYTKLADRFTAEKFDANDLIRRAKNDWGMRYAVLTAKHHEGFCLYDSQLTNFTAVKTAAKRDLVAEFVEACRKHNVKIGLYHTLNDWSVSPNAVDALERPQECHQSFIDFVHGQIREIMTNYGKIDILWYDGTWPFDGSEKGWQAEKLNAMVRRLQPGILVNGRCGIPGDFSTPENHITSANGMWEACMTLNNNWGYHGGDHNWKSPKAVTEMLRQVASGGGNLLLNVGPKPDGSIPQASIEVLDTVGAWLKANGQAIYDSDRFVVDMYRKEGGRADWTPHGRFTARGNNLYLHLHSWPGPELIITGMECAVQEVEILGEGPKCHFRQMGTKVVISNLPESYDTTLPVVMHFRTREAPQIYRSGGLIDPSVPHCRYDPIPSEVNYL